MYAMPTKEQLEKSIKRSRRARKMINIVALAFILSTMYFAYTRVQFGEFDTMFAIATLLIIVSVGIMTTYIDGIITIMIGGRIHTLENYDEIKEILDMITKQTDEADRIMRETNEQLINGRKKQDSKN